MDSKNGVIGRLSRYPFNGKYSQNDYKVSVTLNCTCSEVSTSLQECGSRWHRTTFTMLCFWARQFQEGGVLDALFSESP